MNFSLAAITLTLIFFFLLKIVCCFGKCDSLESLKNVKTFGTMNLPSLNMKTRIIGKASSGSIAELNAILNIFISAISERTGIQEFF